MHFLKTLFGHIVFWMLFCSNNSYSQHITKFKLPTSATSSDYQKQTIVFQIKENLRHLANIENINSQAIQQIIAHYGTINFGKKFPYSPKPSSKYDRHKRKLTDLSLIYEWHYNSEAGIEQVINELLATGMLIYAEPDYVNHFTYIPNDTAIGSNSGTWWYEVNKAFQAWDIQKGDTNIVIGITDTGTDLVHEDLAANTKRNYSDPIDGIDNDNDNYVDNFNGWDIGQNDNNPTYEGIAHGVHVAGLCAATPDNIVGMVGSGFNCKFLPIKITDENDVITRGYEGIVYAAEHGCRIINCSWGSSYPSITGELVVNYVTVNKNALVIAGCGNDNKQTDFYPASFQYVMSIASHSNISTKSPFSNFSYNVDILAPGQMVMSTWPSPENGYLVSNGTSMSSPVVAGTAGLVLSQYPWMDALQVAEQIKATADLLDTISGNEVYANRLGKGQLNMYKAVSTSNAKSAELELDSVFDMNDGAILALDTVNINFTATNYLAPLSNANISLNIESPYATVISGNVSFGNMNTYQTFNNQTPFQFKVNQAVPINYEVILDFTISDGSWSTHIYRPIKVNVDFLNIVVNEVHTTVTSRSSFAYNNNTQNEGLGFQFEGENLLYEGGFFCGKDTIYISDNLRNVSGGNNSDFTSIQRVVQTPAAETDAAFESLSYYADTDAMNPLPVHITQRSTAYNQPGHTQYIKFDYTIKNTGNEFLTNFYSGIFTDWDIIDYSRNRADEIQQKKLGFAYSTDNFALYAGVQLLSGDSFFHYALDNIGGGSGGINLFDGFSKSEKYFTLSNNRSQAGQSGIGNDIANIVSTGPYSIASHDSIKVSFALLAGKTLEDLLKSADSVQSKYNTENSSFTSVLELLGDCNNLCTVFPNPVNNELNFNTCFAFGEEYCIVIMSIDGREHFYKKYNGVDRNEQIKINTEALEQGLYLISLQTSINSCRIKFIKKKQ